MKKTPKTREEKIDEAVNAVKSSHKSAKAKKDTEWAGEFLKAVLKF